MSCRGTHVEDGRDEVITKDGEAPAVRAKINQGRSAKAALEEIMDDKRP